MSSRSGSWSSTCVLLAAQQDRLQRLADLVEVVIADDLADLVAHLVLVEQAEGRPEAEAIDELDDGDQFLQPVLQRRAGEDDGVGRGDLLDAAGDARVPVLDALGLVEDDQVGRPGVDQVEVGVDGVVVDDLEEAAGSANCGSRVRLQAADDLSRCGR